MTIERRLGEFRARRGWQPSCKRRRCLSVVSLAATIATASGWLATSNRPCDKVKHARDRDISAGAVALTCADVSPQRGNPDPQKPSCPTEAEPCPTGATTHPLPSVWPAPQSPDLRLAPPQLYRSGWREARIGMVNPFAAETQALSRDTSQPSRSACLPSPLYLDPPGEVVAFPRQAETDLLLRGRGHTPL